MNKDYIKPDSWSIIEEGFDATNVELSESLFSIGNGAMGQRANFEATYAPIPIKKLCIAKPFVRWCSGKLSPTNALNGSIETLIEASIINNIPAANHSTGEFGITNNASDARIAPTKK